MNRRQLLGVGASIGIVSLSGCLTRLRLLRCNIAPWDQNADSLKTAKAPSSVSRLDYVVIIHYKDLSASEQHVVEKAVTRGSYAQCHAFKGKPNGIMQLGDRIQQQWDARNLKPSQAYDRTFIEYHGEYYGIELFETDMGIVSSIGYPCSVKDNCRAFTDTPEPIQTTET